MTVKEAIRTVEASGGWLSLDGDKVRYLVPGEAADAMPTLRENRDLVIRTLKQRAGFLRAWVAEYCVGMRHAYTNPRILYCHYYHRVWLQGAMGYDSFLRELEQMGWPIDSSDMIDGLCLAEDFMAAVKIEEGSYGNTDGFR